MPANPSLLLPDELREAVLEHLSHLRKGFEARGWGERMGFGRSPAVVVVDLAVRWVDSGSKVGGDLESAVEHTRQVLDVARGAGVPIFFTTMGFGEDDPPSPKDMKSARARPDISSNTIGLDPRLQRRPDEKLIVKKYASAFKGTDLQEMLAALGVDTVIVTGCSTSHCITATCRDASSSYRVIVPQEAVGDRCELFNLAYLLDIDLSMGDVLPTAEVVAALESLR